MIGIVLIYFIWKAYYELARKYNKHKWGIAILGIAGYFLGLLIGIVLIALTLEFLLSESIEDYSDNVLGLMSLPVAILFCWLLYIFLDNQWNKPSRTINDEVLDGELLR
jgi:multisubunit Na+/H+ antiporter MnhB subunit